MKKLLIGLVLAGSLPLATGCATPAYSAGGPTIKFPEERANGENANRIVRNWWFESRQITDDFNHAMLLDPPGRLTKWNPR